MGTELMRVRVKEDNDEFPSVPPGFETFTSFNITSVNGPKSHDEKNELDCPGSSGTSELPMKMETSTDIRDTANITRLLRKKPGISYDECEAERSTQNFHMKLPKGVIRGCSECLNCQKVAARWRPEDARRPDIQNAPVFYPTEEEFEDTLRYMASIRLKAEPYGICRIVPPPSWKPPCPLKEKSTWENSKFATRVQRIDKLQNRDSLRKMSIIQSQMKKKRRRCSRMGAECVTSGKEPGDAGHNLEAETFGFEPGPEFSLETFGNYANDFKSQYFSRSEDSDTVRESSEPSVETIEGEYWRMIETPTEEIEVLYGADLETGSFGSGFPKASTIDSSMEVERYIKSGWNLNNFPRLPGSVLSYESSDISGVLVPWLYIGMCFSSFCWHVEDHHLYSLNYMHWGSPKLWYGVAGKDASKLEEAMRKHLPDLFQEQPDLLHKLVTQLSPSILRSEGVPVYRCVQNPGEFVLTFPRAYHSGFNSGFNCAEAVNVAPVDWLPHGQVAIGLYCDQGRKTSISHDKLLLGAAREAVRAHWEMNLLKKNSSDNIRWKDVCGKDGILATALKSRVEIERMRREFLCSSSQAVKMESNFDASSERECSICYFDLHLSAAGCHCSPDKYACLNHAKQLCPCAWGDKFFLFRYDITELNILVEALEGKLSAIYRWARFDLGLSLSSYVMRENRNSGNSHLDRADSLEGLTSQSSINPLKEKQDMELHKQNDVNSSNENPTVSRAVLPSNETPVKIEETTASSSDARTPVWQLNRKENPCTIVKLRVRKPVPEQNDVILLSDDEDDDPKKLGTEDVKVLSAAKSSDHSLDAKVRTCEHSKELSLPKPVISTAETGEKADSLLTVAEVNKSSTCSVHVKDEVTENYGQAGSILPKISLDTGVNNIQESSNIDTNVVHNVPKLCNDSSNLAGNARPLPGSMSANPNNLDRYYRQKGPRLAKVVRRINCTVEPLEIGDILSGKSWCNSQAIFPKGFKSRVKYMSVLDPSNMCHYVSEVIDAGRDEPLFMVSLENFPTEMFVHGSAMKCWEMVRDRLNQEITRHHKLGRPNLPPLQPPGSLDGFEMFGFTSPAIVQAIEAMDRNRVCSEYWDSRPYSRPQLQIPQLSRSKNSCENASDSLENLLLPDGTDSVLAGLFERSSLDELNTLYSTLNDNTTSTSGRDLVVRLLNKEINKRK